MKRQQRVLLTNSSGVSNNWRFNPILNEGVRGKKWIRNVLMCFLRHDGLTWPNHVVLMTSYLVKFLFQIFAGFWVISMLKIDFLFFFQSVEVIALQKFFWSLRIAKKFSNFHCMFDKVKRFVCFFLWIAFFWFQ